MILLAALLVTSLSTPAAEAAPVTLDDAWASATGNSREIKLLEEVRIQNDTLKTQALSLIGPKLVAGGNFTLNQRETTLDFSTMFPQDIQDLIESLTGAPVDFGDPLVINKKSYFDWNVSVIQPVFSGTALPLYKGAVATVKAGRAQEDVALAKVRTGVAQAYWGVLVARVGEGLAGDALANARKHLDQAQLRVSVGTATAQLGLQAEIAVARAERELAGAQQARVSAEMAFANLTGLPANAELVQPEARTLPYDSAEAAVQRALTQRPDIRAAGYQALAAHDQALGTSLSWLPSVDGRFTEAYTQNSGFSGEPYNWQFVLKADWVLWDGGNRLAQQAKAASMVRMAETNTDKTTADAQTEVTTLWEQHERAKRSVDAVDHELALATENARLAEAAFDAGTLAFLDLEDARLGLDAARLTQMTERMNLDVTAIQLLAATGDLR